MLVKGATGNNHGIDADFAGPDGGTRFMKKLIGPSCYFFLPCIKRILNYHLLYIDKLLVIKRRVAFSFSLFHSLTLFGRFNTEVKCGEMQNDLVGCSHNTIWEKILDRRVTLSNVSCLTIELYKRASNEALVESIRIQLQNCRKHVVFIHTIEKKL